MTYFIHFTFSTSYCDGQGSKIINTKKPIIKDSVLRRLEASFKPEIVRFLSSKDYKVKKKEVQVVTTKLTSLPES